MTDDLAALAIIVNGVLAAACIILLLCVVLRDMKRR